MAKNKATMTDRERMEALLRRERPDRIPNWPIALGFCTVYTGGSIADAYNNPEVSLAAQRKTCRDFDWIYLPMMGGTASLGPEFGGDFKWPSGDFSQAPMITRFPVDTEEDVWNLKMPDVKTAGTVPLRMEFYKLSSQEWLDNEPFNVMFWEGG